MDKIQELLGQEEDLKQSLIILREKIQKELDRYYAEKFGIKPGMIVKDDKGGIFRVVRGSNYFSMWRGKPWIVANPQKKNGGFSRREQTVYFWELVE